MCLYVSYCRFGSELTMGTVTASKFTPLKTLLAIKANGYLGLGKPGKRKDYCPESIDSLIWEKQGNKSAKSETLIESQYDELEAERLELKELLASINKHKDKYLTDFTMTCIVNDLSTHISNHI